MTCELRLGRWQDALADVEMVDALITDPPYSARTDKGYRSATDYNAEKATRGIVRASESKRPNGRKTGLSMPRTRFELPYKPIDRAWVEDACGFFVPRVRQWFVVFGDHESSRWWEAAFIARGLVTFAPVPWVRTDSAPRFAADGPACSCEWITIARPRGKVRRPESRPGYYLGIKGHQNEKIVTGGKPLWLMRSVIRDYSQPGDLIVDPCAGGATTLIAARMEGRRSIGAECDPATHAAALARIQKPYTPLLPYSTESANDNATQGNLWEDANQ